MMGSSGQGRVCAPRGTGIRSGRLEFLVLNVFSFQNNFPVGPTSNPMSTQSPNAISTVSWEPCKRVQVSLPAKASLLCVTPSEGGPGRPGKETELRPTGHCAWLSGAPGAVDSAFTQIEGDKNTRHPLTTQAHRRAGLCSKHFEF